MQLQKTFLILTIFNLQVLCLQAQSNWKENSSEKRITYKVDLTKLIEPDMNLSVAVENKFHKKFSYQLQADYIFNNYLLFENFLGENTTVNAKGFRLIPEFRNYFFVQNDKEYPTYYVSAQCVLKHMRATYTTWITKTNAAGESFQENTDLFRNKTVIAPHLMFGKMFFLDADKRWCFDFNIGLGMRVKTGAQSAELNAQGFLAADLNYTTISAASNFKLGYSIYR